MLGRMRGVISEGALTSPSSTRSSFRKRDLSVALLPVTSPSLVGGVSADPALANFSAEPHAGISLPQVLEAAKDAVGLLVMLELARDFRIYTFASTEMCDFLTTFGKKKVGKTNALEMAVDCYEKAKIPIYNGDNVIEVLKVLQDFFVLAFAEQIKEGRTRSFTSSAASKLKLSSTHLEAAIKALCMKQPDLPKFLQVVVPADANSLPPLPPLRAAPSIVSTQPGRSPPTQPSPCPKLEPRPWLLRFKDEFDCLEDGSSSQNGRRFGNNFRRNLIRSMNSPSVNDLAKKEEEEAEKGKQKDLRDEVFKATKIAPKKKVPKKKASKKKVPKNSDATGEKVSKLPTLPPPAEVIPESQPLDKTACEESTGSEPPSKRQKLDGTSPETVACEPAPTFPGVEGEWLKHLLEENPATETDLKKGELDLIMQDLDQETSSYKTTHQAPSQSALAPSTVEDVDDQPSTTDPMLCSSSDPRASDLNVYAGSSAVDESLGTEHPWAGLSTDVTLPWKHLGAYDSPEPMFLGPNDLELALEPEPSSFSGMDGEWAMQAFEEL